MSSAPVSEDDALSAPAVATGTTLIRARLGFPCIASHEDGVRIFRELKEQELSHFL